MSSNIADQKPREFWINVFHDQYTHHQIAHNSRAVADACSTTDSEHRVDCIHVREVLSSVSVETKTEDLGETDAQSDLKAVLQNARIWLLGAEHHSRSCRQPFSTGYTPCVCGLAKLRSDIEKILSEDDGGSLASGASSPNPISLTEPASGKFKMSIFEELLNKAQLAADELVATPLGSYHYELGIALQLAIERAAK